MPARRTSNEMKVLNGTARKDRLRDEPDYKPVEDYPEAPDWINGPEAAHEWRERIRDLVDALAPLGHYCNLHGAIVKQWRAGMSPTAAELTQFRMLATEFGFTPASRTKAGGFKKAKEEVNPFARLSSKAG